MDNDLSLIFLVDSPINEVGDGWDKVNPNNHKTRAMQIVVR